MLDFFHVRLGSAARDMPGECDRRLQGDSHVTPELVLFIPFT